MFSPHATENIPSIRSTSTHRYESYGGTTASIHCQWTCGYTAGPSGCCGYSRSLGLYSGSHCGSVSGGVLLLGKAATRTNTAGRYKNPQKTRPAKYRGQSTYVHLARGTSQRLGYQATRSASLGVYGSFITRSNVAKEKKMSCKLVV